MRHLLTILIHHPGIFEGRLSSTAACPVVDELFPLSLCLHFPAETDTVLLFSQDKLLSWGAQVPRTSCCSPVAEGGQCVSRRWSSGGYPCRICRRMTPRLLQPFPLSPRSCPPNALSPKNGPLGELITRWSVMSLHKHVTRMGWTVTYFVVLGVLLMTLLVKSDGFTVVHAPAAVWKTTKTRLLSDF